MFRIEFCTKKSASAFAYLPTEFCTVGYSAISKFNSKKLLFEAFSHIMRIFALGQKVNLIFHFCTF